VSESVRGTDITAAHDGYRVDLEQLDRTAAHLAGLQEFMARSLADLDARLTAANRQRSGPAAAEHATAQWEWMMSAYLVVNDIAGLQRAAAYAHTAYLTGLEATDRRLGEPSRHQVTTIDVRPSVYYTAADALFVAACKLTYAVQDAYGGLAACGSMAGSDDDDVAWSKSYDTRAAQAIDLATALASTLSSYSEALRTLGYNHCMADYMATTGVKGPAPERPVDLPHAVAAFAPLPPSAGGPGNGLSDPLRLAEKVGIPIPDGDTDKLGAVGDAWAALRDTPAVSGLSDELGRVIESIRQLQSPEVDTVINDLTSLRDSEMASGFGDLARDCHDYAAALHDLRRQLKKQLEKMAKALNRVTGISPEITVGASSVTFGGGAPSRPRPWWAPENLIARIRRPPKG